MFNVLKLFLFELTFDVCLLTKGQPFQALTSQHQSVLAKKGHALPKCNYITNYLFFPSLTYTMHVKVSKTVSGGQSEMSDMQLTDMKRQTV